MGTEIDNTLKFLQQQSQNYGGTLEIEPGIWALFSVPNDKRSDIYLVRSLLSEVEFAYEKRESEDGRTVFTIETAQRAAAIYWLTHYISKSSGTILPLSPEHRALIRELLDSDQPHRAADKLAAMHSEGNIHAGLIRSPKDVRSLFDRLHQREPLFFAAFNTLLKHHLIDMVVLFQKFISEDLNLQNEIVRGGVSRDPFLQSRQDATGEIRNALIRFFVISPMDQLKNIGINNPYSAHLEVCYTHGEIKAFVNGINCTITRDELLTAIRSLRIRLYHGGSFETFGTQSPWMTPEIAHPFRYIRERLNKRSDLTPLDALYMLERAVAL